MEFELPPLRNMQTGVPDEQGCGMLLILIAPPLALTFINAQSKGQACSFHFDFENVCALF